MHRIGILVGKQGRGSNMLAIHRACQDGRLDARVDIVVAPSEAAPAVHSAREAGLDVRIIPYPEQEVELPKALQGLDVVCLAGYMRLLPETVLRAFPNRVLNIHPALLPKFGGKGMYGMHVHEAVVAAGETESGCSVHLVNEQYDEGAVVCQRKVQVHPGDTPQDLAARVLEQEHLAYPEAIRLVLGS